MSIVPHELDAKTYAETKSFCAQGDAFAGMRMYAQALDLYQRAWEILPEPKMEWEASTWIMGALADAHFLSGDAPSAKKALETAMFCPGGLGNPFLNMRYGQVLFDLGDLDAAAEHLIRGYMGGGEEIFSRDDPKYLAFLKTRAII